MLPCVSLTTHSLWRRYLTRASCISASGPFLLLGSLGSIVNHLLRNPFRLSAHFVAKDLECRLSLLHYNSKFLGVKFSFRVCCRLLYKFPSSLSFGHILHDPNLEVTGFAVFNHLLKERVDLLTHRLWLVC